MLSALICLIIVYYSYKNRIDKNNKTLNEAGKNSENTYSYDLNFSKLSEDIQSVDAKDINEIRIVDDSGVYSIDDVEIIGKYVSQIKNVNIEYVEAFEKKIEEDLSGGWMEIHFLSDEDVLITIFAVSNVDNINIMFQDRPCKENEIYDIASEIERNKLLYDRKIK